MIHLCMFKTHVLPTLKWLQKVALQSMHLVPVSHIHENINWDDEKGPIQKSVFIDQIESKLGFEGLKRESISFQNLVITP